MATALESGYTSYEEGLTSNHYVLLPTVLEFLGRPSKSVRLFELGCGNGAIAAELDRRGWTIAGVDASTEGIAQANRLHPRLNLQNGSAYDDLAARFGQFDYVLSLEVVEHLYSPQVWARTMFNLTRPGGNIIVSTPYHGYWKNLALAATGKLEEHLMTLAEHGHIKFFSIKTLTALLTGGGFSVKKIARVGRVPPFAMCMVAVATRPNV